MTFTDLIHEVSKDMVGLEFIPKNRGESPEEYKRRVELYVLMVIGLTLKYGDIKPDINLKATGK